MKQKKLITIISIVAGVIVLMGLIGGSVLAADPTPTSPDAAKTPKVTYNARLAEKLNISQATLEAAIAQVQKDIQMEALSARLQALVDAGKMTQAQADSYKTWMGNRPADVPALPDMRGGSGSMMGPGFGGMHGGFQGGPGGPQGGPQGGFGERGQRSAPPATTNQ